MKPKAYIVLRWETGLGDLYSAIISSYYIIHELETIGYEASLIINVIKNIYFSERYPLTHIFDFSPFGEKIIFDNWEKYTEKCIHIPQDCKSLNLYVTEILTGIRNYQYKLLNTPEYKQEPEKREYKFRHIQFLNKKVTSLTDNFIGEKSNKLGGISIRVFDYHLEDSLESITNNPIHLGVTERVQKFLNTCNLEHIFITSSNLNVVRELLSLDRRLFTYNFTHEYKMHYPRINNSLSDDSNLVEHTQEIAATMAVFSRCKSFSQVLGNPSSFMCYGISHNIHYSSISETLQHFTNI